MKTRQLEEMGIPGNTPAHDAARKFLKKRAKLKVTRSKLKNMLRLAAQKPEEYTEHTHLGDFSAALIHEREAKAAYVPRPDSAPFTQWGDDLEPDVLKQMHNACKLPIAVIGALMPDAHMGYGLPIGGVLAVKDAVIPYAVGVDIACRMKLSFLDVPVHALTKEQGRLARALEEETSFGVGAKFSPRRGHDVLDEDWSVSPVTERLKPKAWKQLGTSGSGNHFVEFGLLTLESPDLGLEAGEYVALMSHSGSRGVGGEVAGYYSRMAMRSHPELPKELKHLSWLAMDSAAGREYWAAMQLMGKYSAANHDLIHKHVVKNLGATVLAGVENHHNFAWKEIHNGQELIVHRKGATPAGKGQLGVIPGSMGSPGYVVRGLGNPLSLNSASHGAGRKMSRKKANELFSWEEVKALLKANQVTLLSAGLDEAPMAYKDIHEVMAAQQDLVEPVAKFAPRLVKMAPENNGRR